MKKIFKTFLIVSFFIPLIPFSRSYSQMFWNQAASFTGSSSSYASVPNSGSLDITGSFTIEAWVNPASLSGASKGILAKGGSLGTSLKYAVRLNTAGRVSIITNGAQRLISRISNPLIVNNWKNKKRRRPERTNDNS